jgi:hypothetical protein
MQSKNSMIRDPWSWSDTDVFAIVDFPGNVSAAAIDSQEMEQAKPCQDVTNHPEEMDQLHRKATSSPPRV